jgi:hypothetical protein
MKNHEEEENRLEDDKKTGHLVRPSMIVMGGQ